MVSSNRPALLQYGGGGVEAVPFNNAAQIRGDYSQPHESDLSREEIRFKLNANTKCIDAGVEAD